MQNVLQTAGIIVLVVLFFNLMIFVHELGHFLAGKWRGAYIDRFQIWFGKPLWKKKIGGVQWGIGWLPVGGFVSLPQLDSMEGSIEGGSDVPNGLRPLKPLDKIIIAAAGPLFSLLLAYVFAVFVFAAGKPTLDSPGTQIGYVQHGSPAQKAGLLPGDTVLSVDGHPVTRWSSGMQGVHELIALSEHSDGITFTVRRPGCKEPLTIKSSFEQPPTKWWQRTALRRVGIQPASSPVIGRIYPGSPAALAGLRPGQRITHVNDRPIYSPRALFEITEESRPGTALQLTLTMPPDSTDAPTQVTLTPVVPTNWQGKPGARPMMGFVWADAQASLSFEYPSPQTQVNDSMVLMWDTLKKLCTAGSSVKMEHLAGPVGIGNYFYKMMDLGGAVGWRLVLWFAVVLNVNLAVLNMLPLPVVDGGHVTLGIIEAIRGKAISGRILNGIGCLFVCLLMALFLYITLKDVGEMVSPSSAKDARRVLPDSEPSFL